MSDAKLSEEEIHNHPEFLTIERIIQDLSEVFEATTQGRGLTTEEGIALIEKITDAVIDNEILTHMSIHEALRLGQGVVPKQLLGMVLLPLTRVWYQAFLVGAKYQAMKDADLVSLPDDFDVSSFLGETPAAPVVERDVPDIEQVQAVQELPSEDKRSLFKKMLGKKDEDTPASE